MNNEIKVIKGYKSKLDLVETQVAIKYVKDTFEKELSKELDLTRVSAPLLVFKESGLNDELSGKERPVKFDAKNFNDQDIEIVQSLAKWKRDALKKYNFPIYKGLYTDMNAIRRDEIVDNIHSIYVDQWDYELRIKESDRNLNYLFNIVKRIYKVLLLTEKKVNKRYKVLRHKLNKDIKFISTEELLNLYPNVNTSKEREYLITKKYGSVFIYGIGWPLSNKKPHDSRASDYDDWNLNGDILVYDDVLDIALELSSMGIRVNKESIKKQIEFKGELDKFNNPYVKNVLNDNLPFTLGGGIGQSRICLFYLEKAHIGEVQASLWTEEEILKAEKNGVFLL